MDDENANNSSITQRFNARFTANFPPERWNDVTVLVAVSGGADSVALLRVMAQVAGGMGWLVAAHFNHRLRRDDSDDDEAFVRDLSCQLNLPCEVERADDQQFSKIGGEGLEAAARAARYRFFQDAAHRCGARYVATAHTVDDQAETVLHRILRGTGLTGLAGIPRQRLLCPGVTLVRPLLDFRRNEIIAYLESIQQPYRHDASNDQLRFTRNRIRRELLPQLAADYNSNVVESLLRLSTIASEAQTAVDHLASELLDRAVTETGPQRFAIECDPLRDQPVYLVCEMLIAAWRRAGWPEQAMGFDQWRELAELIQGDRAEPNRTVVTLPSQIRAEKKGGQLILTRPDSDLYIANPSRPSGVGRTESAT